ncbi:MAG: metallophosphoesterase [Ruminococcaceae bacterium]|nr:metallophosphoesterase [Oscillospiraceae bacterium]
MSLKTYKYNRVSFFAPERKKLRITLFLVITFVLLCITAIGITKDNFSIAVREINIEHEQIPEEFDGYRILQISDINGQYFGNYQERLINAIDSLKGNYDIVIMTGDYVSDPETEDFRPVLDVLEYLNRSTPVYYCLGERDYAWETEDVNTTFMAFNPITKNALMEEMEKAGATFIYPIQEVTKGDSRIFITGPKYYEAAFTDLGFDMDEHFSICVTHAPITYNVSSRISEKNSVRLQEVDYDFSISGHTLGGVIRLPILGAVYAPSEGAFPQENNTYGLHTDDAGRINYISSGLGSTDRVPFRVMNTPEICVFTLQKAKS